MPGGSNPKEMAKRVGKVASYKKGIVKNAGSFPAEYWLRKRNELRKYVMENPDATAKTIIAKGFKNALLKFYDGRANRIREELGFPERYKNSRYEYSEYLKERDEFLRRILRDSDETGRILCAEDIVYALRKFDEERKSKRV